MQQAQANSKKIVGYQEALEVARNLRWRMAYLEERGVMGADFLAEINEELNAAKAVLSRKFNAKAKANGLDEMVANRVARIENHIFNTAGNCTTVH